MSCNYIRGVYQPLSAIFTIILTILGTEELVNISKNMENIDDIQEKIGDRCVWMASSIHKGEEEGNYNG